MIFASEQLYKNRSCKKKEGRQLCTFDSPFHQFFHLIVGVRFRSGNIKVMFNDCYRNSLKHSSLEITL